MGQYPMPTGAPTVWYLDAQPGNFLRQTPTAFEKMKSRKIYSETGWLDFIAWQEEAYIKTAADGKQITAGITHYSRCDGYMPAKRKIICYRGCR